MIKLINNFYLKKPVLIVAFLGAIVGWISWAIVSFVNNETKLGVFAIIFAVITFSLMLSYIRGETSIQKLLFGALFMFLIIDMIEILFVYISLIDKVGVAYVVLSSLILFALTLLFVCHIIEQSDHVGKSMFGLVGQLCGILMLLWLIFVIVMIAKKLVSESDISFAVSFVFTVFMLICMETRINKYKQIRSEKMSQGAWSEEARQEAKKLFRL